MTQPIPPPLQRDIEAFIGRVIGDLGAAFSGVLVNVGRKLGLYQAMLDLGTCTTAELAEKTGVRERYVREWLANQVAGGYVAYDPENQTYSLPPAQAMVLANDQSPIFMVPAFEVASSFWLDEDLIVETFRSGEGLGWHAHNHRLFCGTESFFRTGYRAHLVNDWLPALDGIIGRLQSGARVADIGCGHGASTIMMAQAFPKSSFLGVDYHDASIVTARKRAIEEGVATNIAFEVMTATEFHGRDFDLICFMDCLHDLGDPVGALASCRRALKPDGKVLLVEPYAGDRLEENLNPIGRMYYAASAMACTPNSLSQDVGLGLGAQAGEQRLREVARQAGYSNLRRASQTPVNLILELTP
ncbi:MAG: class I SAM-dependent methyltransferase [Proteobacteria bacterium]|nr:class I SAM-dependent methyltransferase [Pseudomonadota bacterium]MBS0270454.1 class I SAM-dependent methyltransferase [Pseudomonadota bacterium]